MDAIIKSFIAFNQNGWAHLRYTLRTNLWYIGIIIGVIACIVLYMREEIAVTVHEEQQVL